MFHFYAARERVLDGNPDAAEWAMPRTTQPSGHAGGHPTAGLSEWATH